MSRAFALILASLVAIASSVIAQDRNPNGPGKVSLVGKGVLGLGTEPALYPAGVLLERPAVQEELQLKPMQLTRWRRLVEDEDRDPRIPDMLKAQREAYRANPVPELQQIQAAQLRELQTAVRKEYESQLSRILDARQRNRLGEIQLQVEGPMAFTRPEIQERLNLDPFQVEAIHEVVAQGRNAAIEASAVANNLLPSPGASKEKRQQLLGTKTVQTELEKRRSAMSDARRQTMQAIARLLTKGQRTKYQKMLGESFDLVKLRTKAEKTAVQPDRSPTPGGTLRDDAASAL